jgi:2-oxo-3-hexenedioate decarboxylase
LSLDEAYRMQHCLIRRRAERGDGPVGVKLGFTSKAKMLQMGVDTVIVGSLTSSMLIEDGGSVSLDGFIHPRIEPEIAFRLGADVDLDGDDAALLNNIDGVAPALEIIDSRYAGFAFTLSSVVADNTSASAFAVGPWQRFNRDGDLENRAVRLVVGDTVRAVGSTAAILGNPSRVLPFLLRAARTHGFTLNAGDVILAGAATAATPLVEGFAEARVAGLGRTAITVEGVSRG